jgi:hypothetical protein
MEPASDGAAGVIIIDIRILQSLRLHLDLVDAL